MSAPPTSRKVLLVDDDEAFRRVVSAELSRRGYSVATANGGRAALDEVRKAEFDVILLDLRMPDMDGIEVLKRLRDLDVSAGVVVLTGHGTIDTAIQAIRLGAYDYLEKPCPMEKVELTIQRTCEHFGLLARQKILQDGYSPPDVRPDLVGASPAFQKLRQNVTRIARSDATTLILGETGVGKDMVAKLLHREGPRREAAFVVVDCAALHEELLQSELFGHEKGAFSGATRQKHGLFEVAHGGTLFLDEVGDTSPETQSKLLRVLESGRFRRLGGTREIAVDVRVVSATNRDLAEAVSHGRFREDLYFRLATLTVQVPPLRERKEDIPLLVDHYIARFNQRFSRSSRFSVEALGMLQRYAWPGNVRELIHVVEQAIVLSDVDVIGRQDLPDAVRGDLPGPSEAVPEGVAPPLREVERRHVQSVLENVAGNRSQAARVLGISERNLYRLIKRYGLCCESSPAEGEAGGNP
jgi:DNA-binding NtrC family response regulator